MLHFKYLIIGGGMAADAAVLGEDHIIYFRTAQDHRRLRVLAEQGQRFAVIGGGFIGSEIAAALAMNGKQVLMIFLDETLGARVYPRDLGLFLNDLYRQRGIEVLIEQTVTGFDQHGEQFAVRVKGVKQPENSIRGMASWQIGRSQTKRK